jgi:hypothetical protein
MTIWILAVLLIGAGVGMGLRQGAIRAAFTFVGILFAALLAGLVGKIFRSLLPHVGVHSSALIWAIAPAAAFILVLALFKVAGFFVHKKVDVYYKYNAGDVRLSLFTRLNSRLGACVGVLNGTAYLLLLGFLIFNFSYWTNQVAPGDGESRSTRLVNKLGADLKSTGLNKAGRAIFTLPDNYYRMADLAGLIATNRNLSERLGRYPAFISLMERDELQPLVTDATFTNAWQAHAPMGQLMNEPAAKTLLENNDLMNTVWTMVQTNLDDLPEYLKTGKSAKYDSQLLLGHWDFNVSVTVAMLRQARPNISSVEMRSVRAWMMQAYAQTELIAGADGQAFLKNLPQIKGQPPKTENANWTGTWTSGSDTSYELALSANGENKSMTALIVGDRLTLKDAKNVMMFDRD